MKVINILKHMFMILVFICIFSINSHIRVEGYTDTSLYEEKLEFDEEGNLIMTTHDKKATSQITYRTIGWVIKRYDMPMHASGQQYAIIPISDNVKYVDDPKNSAYVYCVYKGDKEMIASTINGVSNFWKNYLYKNGDTVYIDEIMTVVEGTKVCGGLNGNRGKYWGEVYFNYDGISEARKWASKENLKTHFDKEVYFPAQISRKYFKKTVKNEGELMLSHKPQGSLDVKEGTRYYSTYDITQAVPTGSPICMFGEVDKYGYNIIYNKVKVSYSIPIQFITTYTIKWKAYDGSIKTEKKNISEWYYVNKSAFYYDLKSISFKYLSNVRINNYAFNNGVIKYSINNKPRIVKTDYKDDSEHIKFPTYSETHYIDGGILEKYDIPGVKPDIPYTYNQNIANLKIGTLYVRNDELKLNSIKISEGIWVAGNSAAPTDELIVGAKKDIYTAGHLIPHSKENKQKCVSNGFVEYIDYYTNGVSNIHIKNIKDVSIHTPVYISAKIINNGESFSVEPITYGVHNNYPGYGEREYKSHIKNIYLKFDKDIIVIFKDGERKNIEAGTDILWDKDMLFGFDEANKSGNHNVEIRAYAMNISDNILKDENLYVEDKANLNFNNYIAKDNVSFTLSKIPEDDKPEYDIVGTH